jgi:hypothetical protein
MICHLAEANCPKHESSAQVNICTIEEYCRREEEIFIIQASAFETSCRCEAEAHHILHRHAETTHQPGLVLRSKGCIGTGERGRGGRHIYAVSSLR